MEFGETPVECATGAILAHSVRHAGGVFKKGRKLSEADISTLRAAGVSMVFAARLGADDIPEDEAASAIAQIAGGGGVVAQAAFTGRANLHANVHGVAVADLERVRQINHLHESLTLATVANHAVVENRQMVATVKVIPFAVPREVLAKALTLIGTEPIIRIEAFRHRRVGLIITRLPQTKPSLIAKSESAMRQRIEALDGELAAVMTVDHAIKPVSEAIAALSAQHCHPILVFGASAIVDRGDIIPAGLHAAGGEILHLGMPVDPGNLTMYGRLSGVPVIGVPSCARSPKINGFDWVLERVMAGVHMAASDIMDMGAGGLLAEIPSRPSPREGKNAVQKAPRVAAIVLAAGLSKRMGANKLLADVGGKSLIRRTVEAVAGFPVEQVVVVTGHDAERISTEIGDLGVATVNNPQFAEGMAGSLKRGIEAIAHSADAAFICLGDMPLVDLQTASQLIAAFNPSEGRSICVPVHEGRQGNPVLWGSQHFAALLKLSGDHGAKAILEDLKEEVTEVAIANEGVLTDADTPKGLERLRARLAP